MSRQDTEDNAGGRRSALYGIAAAGVSAFAAAFAGGRPVRAAEPQGGLTEAEMIGKSLRVYHSGDAITMDYSEDRLNIELGPDDRIAKVSIG